MAASVQWKAVGASLEDLARTARDAAKNSKQAFAYANSGLIALAGGVLVQRYLVPGFYAKPGRGPRNLEYLAAPGGTHGPTVSTIRDSSGKIMRDERGRFIITKHEEKLFVKGKFVSRSGTLEEAFRVLASKHASPETNMTMTNEYSLGKNGGEIIAGIDRDGRGYIKLVNGYRAAEVGSRFARTAFKQNGVRGVWRSLRAVQGRWKTLLRKKYPDLLKLEKASVR